MGLIDATTELYGVFGNPVRHSKSPILHNGWINDFGINAVYLAFEPDENAFEDALNGLIKAGLKGANFTTPFKEKAANFANEKSDLVANINAANTLKIMGNKVCASITDGAGLIYDLNKRANGTLEKAKTISVLGAGGAAKGLICELLISTKAEINIIARDKEKIAKLLAEIANFGDINRLKPVLWNKMESVFPNSQIIINATSLGLANNGEIECYFGECDKETLVYDMIYYPFETKFLKNAKAAGIRTLNGIGMLVGQAAISFEIWFGKKPDFDIGLKRVLENV